MASTGPLGSLVDIGVNLAHRRFSKDRRAVLERAHAAGIEAILVTGTSAAASQEAVQLVAEESEASGVEVPSLHSTAGVHPHEARTWSSDVESIVRGLVELPAVVAVGECGLDYNRDFSPREAQRAAFEAQLAIAADVNLPVFLHERDAADDFFAILKTWAPRLKGGVLHCFTGGRESAERALELGLHIGVTGWICDERRSDALRDAIPHIPAERLLVETDAPFLTPRDLRPKPKGGRNEPSLLPHVVRAIAEFRGEPAERTAQQSTQNARALFLHPC